MCYMSDSVCTSKSIARNITLESSHPSAWNSDVIFNPVSDEFITIVT